MLICYIWINEIPFLDKFSFFATGKIIKDILQTSFFEKIYDQFDPDDDIVLTLGSQI